VNISIATKTDSKTRICQERIDDANPVAKSKITRSLPALRDPAGKGGRLPDPRRHLRLVELVVLVDP